uniref:Uncharacterized protein n=1 Tax=Candidatus Kentrum sp. SD TaxID=2126332 RepID=A0A451BLY9_9GAMM|nr:MAG: hypothetical protein BECKSD772D_GA0070982_10434 [Candidatus Kentron sp. SD]
MKLEPLWIARKRADWYEWMANPVLAEIRNTENTLIEKNQNGEAFYIDGF